MTDRDQAGADEGGLVGHAAGPSSASASSSPTSLFRQSLAMDALVPPLRFTLLSLSFRDLSPERVASTTPLPRVYSSSHPLPRHLPFLSRLQLKTVVALTPKDPLKQVPAIGTWAEAQGVEVKWVKIGAWKDVGTAAISREVAEETISVREDSHQGGKPTRAHHAHPLHCLARRHSCRRSSQPPPSQPSS